MFAISKSLSEKYPEAHAGILVIKGVENPASHPALEERKHQIEADLRAEFAGADPQHLATKSPIPAYTAFYKRFEKTYHVLGQLNSVVFKGKRIPTVSALVEAMFMAELKNGVLTAGHDLDQVKFPITLNAAAGEEHFTTMRGNDQVLKTDDMFISDQDGILSSVIYGPDQRTQIIPSTKNVLFTSYAPAGIDVQLIENHLIDIRDYVLITSPDARVEMIKVFSAVVK